MSDSSPRDVGDLATHVVEVEVVRNIIFGFLPLQDLLSCSVVSRAWNQAARSFIRNSRVCCIKIPGGQPCKELQSVSTLLEKSSALTPFNGLSLNVLKESHTGPCEIGWKELQQACRPLFAKLELKFLTVQTKPLDTFVECPAVKLIVKLLIQKGSQLQELEMGDVKRYLEMAPWHLCDPQQKPAFRNLRILKSTNVIPMRTSLEFYPLLFREAPNLNVMFGSFSPMGLAYFPRDKIKIIKDFRIITPFDQDDLKQVCLQVASVKPKLERLAVDHLGIELAFAEPRDAEDAKSMLQVLNTLLESSASSLKIFELELRLLLRPDLRLQDLKKVETLKLQWDGGFLVRDHPPLPILLRTFDLTAWFPHLRRIEFFGHFIEDRRTVMALLQNEEYRVVSPVTSVTELVVQIEFSCVLNILADLFPSVRKLEVVYWRLDAECLVQLWTAWPKLVALTVKEEKPEYDDYEQEWISPHFRGYCDAVFSGIDKKECRRYRSMEAMELRALQLPRRRPNLLDLTELQELHLSFEGTALTHLTMFLTLERTPGVTVKHNFMEVSAYFSDESFASSEDAWETWTLDLD